MFVEVDELVDFCVEHSLNVEQVFFCYILYLDKIEGTRWDPQAQSYNQGGPHIANVYKYIQKPKGGDGRMAFRPEDIEDLEEKEFIVDRNRKKPSGNKESYPDMYEVTDKFVDAVMSSYTLFDEFWDEYPGFTANFDNPRKGNRIPLKATPKSEVKKIYSEQIKSRQMHSRLMKGLRYAKRQGEITMNIAKWLSAEYWKEYLKEMQEQPTEEFGPIEPTVR